jgi:hypothetical protein
VSEEAARRPATSAFLTEAERSEAHCSGTGETLVLWLGVSREPFLRELLSSLLNPPIGSITASASTIYRLPKPLY